LPIYQLLSKLLEKGKVKPNIYAHWKNEIIRDAQYDINKLLSSNENKKRSGSSYDYWGDYHYDSYDYDYGDYDYNSPGNNNPANDLKSSEKKIYNFAVMLYPYYSNSAVKKEIINKIIRSGSDDLAISVIAYYLKKGTNISDTLWDHYSEKPATQLSLYKSLDYVKHLDKFNVKYLTSEKLAVSQLFAEDFDLDEDSVVLIRKQYIESKKDSGYIYIFKACAKDESLWKLGYTGIHPVDSTKINTDPDIFSNSKSFELDSQMNEEIKEMSKKVRVLGRNRVSSYGYNYYDNYGRYSYGDY
jgi:hypothetical protein